MTKNKTQAQKAAVLKKIRIVVEKTLGSSYQISYLRFLDHEFGEQDQPGFVEVDLYHGPTGTYLDSRSVTKLQEALCGQGFEFGWAPLFQGQMLPEIHLYLQISGINSEALLKKLAKK